MITRGSFLVSAAGVLAAAASPKPSPSPSPAPTATPFPWDLCEQNPALPYNRPLGLRMRVLDGPDFDLVKYRGYGVLLNIFATWCKPCAFEMPAIVANAAKYHDRGLRIIGIDVRESDDAVRAYRKKYAIPFPIAMDEQGGFAYNLEHGNNGENTEFPALLFIAPDGYLYCDKRGSSEHPEAELTYRIEKFLKDAPPSASPSPQPVSTSPAM